MFLGAAEGMVVVDLGGSALVALEGAAALEGGGGFEFAALWDWRVADLVGDVGGARPGCALQGFGFAGGGAVSLVAQGVGVAVRVGDGGVRGVDGVEAGVVFGGGVSVGDGGVT